MVKDQMRVAVKVVDPNETIPCAHRHQMQGLIYEALRRGNPEYGSFLHREGYRSLIPNDTRRFKLFSFTPLQGGQRMKGENVLTYPSGKASFYVSSPDLAFVEAFQAGVAADPRFGLGTMGLEILDVAMMPLGLKGDTVVGRTLSPIIVTQPMPGRLPAHHLTPEDEGFSILVARNLVGKYSAWLREEVSADGISFGFFQPSIQESVVSFKEAKYRGVSGIFSISCPDPEMLAFACLAGIGEKNSMGFGFVYAG